MKHVINFRTSSDTGEPELDAIIPYTNGEPVNETVMQRPTENLRTRSDYLRQRARQLQMLSDLVHSQFFTDQLTYIGIQFNGAKPTYAGTVTISGGDLFLAAINTVGDDGAGPPISSTAATLKVGTFGNNQVIFTSDQKAFEGSTTKAADVNTISVEITHTGTLAVSVDGASGRENNILITIDSGTTTCQQLVDAVNAHGAASALVTAAVEGTSTPGNACDLWDETVWSGDYSLRYLTGGVPALTHRISGSNLSTFFGAHADNPMRVGDTIGIWYDKAIESGGIGGRFQSTPENANTNIPAGSFFNSRREPEKVPNSIPLFKCIEEDVVMCCWNRMLLHRQATDQLIGYPAFHEYIGSVSPWNVIDAGPTHNPPRTIKQVFDNVDAHIRSMDVFVTITDGTFTFGGDYEGADALKNAITALNTGGVGGTILCRRGNYVADGTFPGISTKIRIIAIEDAVNILNQRTGSNRVFDITTSGSGSLFEGLLIQESGGSATARAFRISGASDVTIRNCTIQGEIEISDPAASNPLRTLIENCHIAGASFGTTRWALYMEDGDLTTIRNCTIENGNQALAVYYNSAGGPTLSGGTVMENCRITSGNGQSAFVSGSGGYGFIGKKVTVICQPFTNVAGGGQPAVNIAGLHNRFQDLEIYVHATGDIVNTLLKVGPTDTGDIHLTRVYIDMGNNYVKHSALSTSVTNQNPVQFRSDVRVDHLHITKFKLPNHNAAQGNFALDRDEPVIRVEGTSTKPAEINHGRIDGVTADANASYPNEGTILGSKGSNEYFDGNGPYKIFDVTFDLDNIDTLSNHYIRMIGNIGQHTKIDSCTFKGGKDWRLCIFGYGDELWDIDIVDCVFEWLQTSTEPAGIIGFQSAGSPVDNNPQRLRIRGNTMRMAGGRNAVIGTAIDIDCDGTLRGRYIDICDNQITMTTALPGTFTLVYVNNREWSITQGNTIYGGNAANTEYSVGGSESGCVPLSGALGGQNMIL